MKRLRGFAIVSAIFILVVLAALGAFIVNISTTQQIGSALDVQGVRAYQAARAGIEWGLFRVLQDTGFAANLPAQTTNQLTAASSCTSVDPVNPTIASFGFAGVDTLSGFTVTVACFASHDGTNLGPWTYKLTTTACSQPVTGWTATTTACPNTANPGSLYVERRLEVTF
jgi:MSHA biogenesis protein MshP